MERELRMPAKSKSVESEKAVATAPKAPENPAMPEPQAAEETEISETEELAMKLAFPTAAVVREMKKYIAKDKMVRKEVKIGMNKFLAEIVKDVAKNMDQFPYSVVDYRMFEEAVKPYRQVKELQAEKNRVKAHLDVIIQDCDSVKRDLDAKFAEQETQ